MLNNTHLQKTGKRLSNRQLIVGLGLALFLLVGGLMLVAPAEAQTTSSGLTTADVDSLLYMREEEKLAHDVYVTLYELWGAPLFSNIANSEQNHTEMVLALLYQYGLGADV